MQPYDPNREIERLETRLNREMDRRFSDMGEKLKELKTNIEAIEVKIDANTEKLENRQYERQTWTVRQLITILVSFFLGGGALGIVQFIINILSRRP